MYIILLQIQQFPCLQTATCSYDSYSEQTIEIVLQ